MPTDGDDWDPQRTAAAIVAAVRQLEAAGGPFDLLLFGNESADAGGFQVGIRVARALGRPIVNGAKGLDVADGVAHVEREADAGRERYELPLPAVVGVKEGINLPRYPTMKGRLASKKVDGRSARARRTGRRAADGPAATPAGASGARPSCSAAARTPRRRSSTCSPSSGCCRDACSSSSSTTGARSPRRRWRR